MSDDRYLDIDDCTARASWTSTTAPLWPSPQYNLKDMLATMREFKAKWANARDDEDHTVIEYRCTMGEFLAGLRRAGCAVAEGGSPFGLIGGLRVVSYGGSVLAGTDAALRNLFGIVGIVGSEVLHADR